MRHPEVPHIGRIVEVMKGRDRGQYGVVVGHEPDRYVLIADGQARKAEKPKKKNVLHIRPTPHVSEEVKETIASGSKLTNAKLRFALRVVEAEAPAPTATNEGGDAFSG